jgi:hypothetical protein
MAQAKSPATSDKTFGATAQLLAEASSRRNVQSDGGITSESKAITGEPYTTQLLTAIR